MKKFVGLVSDFKNEVGPDSRTSRKKSDGQSDFFGQKTNFQSRPGEENYV